MSLSLNRTGRFIFLVMLMLVVAGVSGRSAQGKTLPRTGPPGRQDPLQLTFIANAGVLVSAGDRKVLIDALFDKPNPEYRAPSPDVLDKIMKGIPPFDGVDLVLVTHNHPDHFNALLAARYLETVPGPILLAPADAVAEMRKAAADWTKVGPRVVALDIKVGEKEEKEFKRISVTVFRTRHSGDLESPMNLMYLFKLDGWRIWHEGDSNGKPDVYRGFGLESAPVDLALVHYWFPLEPNCARFLQEVLKPGHIALTHLPVRLESDAPGKIELVREYYRDLFLPLPGMPAKVFQKEDREEKQNFFGQTPPGPEPVKFLPEILTSEKHPHGQLAFSSDGQDIFWSAMLRDGPEQTIFHSAFDGKTLSRPDVAPFAAASGNGGPAFSADGQRLFFNAMLLPAGDSSKPRTAICYIERSGSGWTKPRPIEATVDTLMTKGQVTVARSGNVYFSGRVLTEKMPGIYLCRYSDGTYWPPEKLGGPLGSVALLVDPWIDPDERFLLVSCPGQDGPPMLTDIGISYRQADGSWSQPVRLGGSVNTPAFERFPSLSPDGRYLFFIRSLSQQFVGDQAHFYWVDASVLDIPARGQRETAAHRDDMAEYQPPGKIMDAIGLKPGSVIGEVGAGTGRFTVWLARRVGKRGLVYANDIDETALHCLEKESQKYGLDNIKIILGKTHDPCFPPRSLDMAFMINVYNAFEDPARFLRNIAPALKPGGTLAIVLDDPAKSGGESERSATREEFLASVDRAGYKVEKEETFLPRDGLYVLRLK
jgi:L-ascorbate metabolism protein UlaG (beta-lactamase superfamily)/precorrin-6B methylase 2